VNRADDAEPAAIKVKVSRSYLSRIESGQMTPSLGTLEKISEALNVGLNRFFIPESDGEALLEDPFIQGLRPFLQQLDWEQWQVDTEEAAGDQRSRERNTGESAPYR